MPGKEKLTKILELLESNCPKPETALHHRNSFELLIAAILSAQTTDKQVNKVTKKLFEKYSTPLEFYNLTPEELEKEIKNCGLYKNKSKNIISTCKKLVDDYKGEVPGKFEDLIKLPGVGRKTANVVLANVFGIPAFPVDTHVQRVSRRLGLADGKNPEVTEKQLCSVIPRMLWNKSHHWLIYLGRNHCLARNPRCHECFMKNLCREFKEKH